MIFEPSWYTLDAADLNDPRFFSILEYGQALNTDWVHEGEDTQMIFGKSIGAGHVVFTAGYCCQIHTVTTSRNMVATFQESGRQECAIMTRRRMLTMGLVWSWMLAASAGGGLGLHCPRGVQLQPTASCDRGCVTLRH